VRLYVVVDSLGRALPSLRATLPDVTLMLQVEAGSVNRDNRVIRHFPGQGLSPQEA